MFDIGFMEMALIGVVALVVIGPERLPGVARTAGKWIGNARRFMSSVQADINMEVNKTDELKRLIEEQTRIQSVHEILEQTPAESDDRKPVPRAVAAKSPAPAKEPEYELKAINDAPAAEDDASSTAQNSKHD
jgi:sec-independent protein translocase protein TatB